MFFVCEWVAMGTIYLWLIHIEAGVEAAIWGTLMSKVGFQIPISVACMGGQGPCFHQHGDKVSCHCHIPPSLANCSPIVEGTLTGMVWAEAWLVRLSAWIMLMCGILGGPPKIYTRLSWRIRVWYSFEKNFISFIFVCFILWGPP